MIKNTFDDLDTENVASTSLWEAYVNINYGKAVPEKGYKGFRTFLEDVTGADLVTGSLMKNFTLYFRDEKQYTWFLLKWG